ncbi:helix-turn-helix domain-containing protein [Arsenicicoccus sp. oral taxon 190]|uniref:helix-turn-helix domain-containing protein n=1 Tax=Arsenicicoccus sp. oral taxon 190 TaxID=1658671 RepID=UPI000679EFDA|nr:helix-turn-helix domain-containing protein [Arsenicicoccus sp. oral taxon 190]AKT50583.1 excisionase [Arsenicicoccus sp. oral taxon 190]
MTSAAHDRLTVLPPEDLETMLDLSTFLTQHDQPAALVGPDGQTVPLPLEAYRVLVNAATAMRAGKAITVAPVDQLLTTQEAADFLGISRPTLVKLLESGRIPFERPAAGRHRRVRLQDVIDYQDSQRAGRRAALDDMTRDAADAGLYDSVPDYTQALAGARREHSRQ